MAVETHITADHDLFIGEDKSLVCTIYQSDYAVNPLTGVVSGTAQNITGWTLSWVLKRKTSDADVSAILTKTTAAGGIALTTAASGIATVTIADTDTDTFTPGTYYHELKRTDAGFETVLITGRAVLKRALHRS